LFKIHARIITKIGYSQLIGFCLVSILLSCAQPTSPRGGPRDEEPPKIDSLKSTTNEQVFFEKQNIKIVFDEFIDLRNPSSSILISPPFVRNPRIYSRGKEIRIEMPEEEELKDNATYVINFGESIADFTEGNKFLNYRFIFSTGAYIDSLSVKGQVKDAFTKEPIEECLVMLYDNFADSVVYNERPFYFALTDENGQFKIENIREDTFKIFVLKDENANYLYDQDNENIGFLDSLIFVDTDTIKNDYDLHLFLPKQDFGLIEYDAKSYGRIDFLFTSSPKNLDVSTSISMDDYITEVSGDSLVVWYDLPKDSSFSVFLNGDNNFVDTIKVRKLKKSDFLKEEEFEIDGKNLLKGNALKPGTDLVLNFNYPISRLTDEYITLQKDSIQIKDYQLLKDSASFNRLIVKHQFSEESSYTLKLDSAAIESIYGTVNDSTSILFEVKKLTDFGSLNLTLVGLDSTINYITTLLEGEKPIKETIISAVETQLLQYTLLNPGGYSLRIVEDLNRNNIWDPGDYQLKKYAEKIIVESLDDIKEGWENEERINATIFKE